MTLPTLRADVARIASVALVAEAARVDDVDVARRIITGTLAPYGEPGRTNLGARALRAGAVRFRQPVEPRVIGLYGHDRERTVSRLVAYENTPTRLALRARVAATPLGDQLLAEAAEGVRSMLSIELDGCAIDPATGDIVDGLCEFYAHVPIGAYDSAHVDSVVAAMHDPTGTGDDVSRRSLARRYSREFITVGGGGQPAPAAQPAAGGQLVDAAGQPITPAPAATPPAGPDYSQLLAQLAGQPAPAAPAPATPAAPSAPAPAAPAAAPADLGGMLQLLAGLQQLQTAMHVAPAAPAGPAMLPGGLGGGAPTTPATPAVDPVRQLATLQAAALTGGANRTDLRAALADITNTGLDLFQSPAGAIGQQLWTGPDVTSRPFVDILDTSETLTSWKGTGWQWKTKPKMAYYAGDKTQVPTNPVEVETVDWEAERCAGGWDIDRKFRDFGDPLFWAGFYKAQTESYREISNDRAAAFIVASALDITVDGNVPASYADINVAQANILKAAALATAILEDTPNVRTGPTYLVMNTMDWLQLIDFTNLDLPAFLSLLKVQPGNFMRSPLVPAGSIIAGVGKATKFRELGGGAPIRVEALDVARAGVDSAVYGYTAVSMERPGGVISVPLAPVAGSGS